MLQLLVWVMCDGNSHKLKSTWMLYSPEVHICVKPLFNVVSVRYDLNAMIPFQLGAKVSA